MNTARLLLWCCVLAAAPLRAETIYVSYSPTGKAMYSNQPAGAQSQRVMQLAAPLARPLDNTVVRAGDTGLPLSAGAALRGSSTRAARAPRPDAATQSLVRQAAARHGIDYHLLMALIQQESGFNPGAVSHAGARGLMQLMAGTARRYGVTRVHDPGENIAAGSAYLRDLLDMFGRFDLALAAYNAGEGAVLRYGRRIPPYPETQQYVHAVTADYERRVAQR
jgi:soluble lytic murein transglycosylase-like protein